MSLSLQALPNSTDGLFSGQADVNQASFSIGRANDNDWVIADPKRTVSKHHCAIEKQGDGYRLVDNSTNGTTVNGRPVDRNTGHTLRDGDEIGVGPYRFKVQTRSAARSWEETSSTSSQPKITAILHDVAPAGVTATSVLPGIQDPMESKSPHSPKQQAKPMTEIGWDGPPEQASASALPGDMLKPAHQEFSNRSEQMPTHSLRIDLPKPKQIIPDDWLAQPASPPAPVKPIIPPIAPPPAPEPVPVIDRSRVIPVENMDVGVSYEAVQPIQPASRPAPAPPPPPAAPAIPRNELMQAFFDGMGATPTRLPQDELRFFHNIGRALAIVSSELHNLQQSGTRTTALLEVKDGAPARTPWIFSLSGDDRAQLPSRIVDFLGDSEPRDLEQMREDFRDNSELLLHLGEAILAVLERVQGNLSISTIEQQAGGGSRLLPSSKKAALWEAFVSRSGLYAESDGKTSNVNLLVLLREAYRTAQKGGSR